LSGRRSLVSFEKRKEKLDEKFLIRKKKEEERDEDIPHLRP
jgi:hypothetical protein